MKSISRTLLLSGLAILALGAVACSSGGSDADADVAASTGIAPPVASPPVDDSPTTIEPTEPDTAITEPVNSGPTNNFIHVLRRGKDGKFKIWRASFAPDEPAPLVGPVEEFPTN